MIRRSFFGIPLCEDPDFDPQPGDQVEVAYMGYWMAPTVSETPAWPKQRMSNQQRDSWVMCRSQVREDDPESFYEFEVAREHVFPVGTLREVYGGTEPRR